MTAAPGMNVRRSNPDVGLGLGMKRPPPGLLVSAHARLVDQQGAVSVVPEGAEKTA